MHRWVLLLLYMPLTSQAIVQESGTLTGFLMDTCLTCAYDNWQSHVAERVVRPGFNDYGPPHLDPQTNRFGGFEYIPANAGGDSTLARWRQVFTSAIRGEWNVADSLVSRYDSLWNYELVEFYDEPSARIYYIMRERLDLSYVDANGDTLPENDVIGGFRKGWGVFVFNDNARHQKVVMQMPHPEDDFVSIPVGIQMFQQLEMGILMIAGAGREVMWDSTQSSYNNARSISDPSRNGRTPFAELSRVATDEWSEPPINPFVIIQLHSYDHATHLSLPDIQVSCYLDDLTPNVPLRDLQRRKDLYHAFETFPITGITADSSIRVAINNYIGLACSPQYTYQKDDTVLTIRSVGDLWGAPDNVEAVYAHVGHHVQRHTENFIHIELDEYPDGLWMPLDWQRWIPGTPPTNWGRYANVLEFYQPFIEAMDSALTWKTEEDTLAPDSCAPIQATDVGGSCVYLRWDRPAYDTHFDTYQIFFDTVEVTLSSPHISRTTTGYSALGDQLTRGIQIEDFPAPVWRYQFALRAKDLLGWESPLSSAIGITDGQIDDLTILVEGDSLRLNWSLQTNDSLFQVWEYLIDNVDYTIIGTTSDNTYLVELSDNPVIHRYTVKRLIRR
ncbi:hypothetical protein HUU59_07955 [bacterium]|nr:hypothetical protein [bacterium]